MAHIMILIPCVKKFCAHIIEKCDKNFTRNYDFFKSRSWFKVLHENHIKCGNKILPEFALKNLVKSYKVSRLQKLCLKKYGRN